MKDVDVYWSFRSPYSYLATPGMLGIQKDFQVKVNLRAVLPVAIRTPETLFSAANAPRVRYIQMDWQRRARFLGMQDQWPSPDPIVQDMETLKISSEQPYIYRLSSLGIEAQRRGLGIEFAYQVSHLLFGGTKNWDKSDHLSKACSRAGLDLESLDSAIKMGDHLQEIEANQIKLDEAGHWGVPTLVFDGEPFFGQDRIDSLRWELSNRGLEK